MHIKISKTLKRLTGKKNTPVFHLIQSFPIFWTIHDLLVWSIHLYQMWCQYFIKLWRNIASAYVLTLDLSESKCIFSIDCDTATGSIQARLVAHWRAFLVSATHWHTIAIISLGSGAREKDFNIHKNYCIEGHWELMIQGVSNYLLTYILFLNLNTLWSFIIYETSKYSIALSCKMASFESSSLCCGGY